MNLDSYAVIGANYGDEGKGLTTDFLARQHAGSLWNPVMVARQNGGAQAGHTVVTPEGLRHIFRHVGAGALTGAKTYLSAAFLVNPIALCQEINELKAMGINPRLICHPDARITTIFDMMINQFLEASRGNSRHGSCGMGINETVRRSEAGYHLTVGIASDVEEMKHALYLIKYHWTFGRLEELGIATAENREAIDSIDINALALDYRSILRHHFEPADPRKWGGRELPLIIEGAQGLAIDEFIGFFPHVTPTVVGLPAAIYAAKECGKTNVTPIYVSRCYATRHGAGPLPHEGEFTPSESDVTNVHNEWQGNLRYALLDVSAMAHRMKRDIERAQVFAEMHHVTINAPQFMLTCLDHMGEYGEFYWNSNKLRFTAETFGEALLSHLRLVVPELKLFGESFGPSSSHVSAKIKV